MNRMQNQRQNQKGPYDLAIAYRIYPKMATPAQGLPFSDDKLKLSEVCLQSFKKSLGNLRVKLWVLLDGCPNEYADLFKKYFGDDELVLVSLEAQATNGPSQGKSSFFALKTTAKSYISPRMIIYTFRGSSSNG